MAFSPPEFCRLFAQKKAYKGGVTGTSGPPPSYAPETITYFYVEAMNSKRKIRVKVGHVVQIHVYRVA